MSLDGASPETHNGFRGVPGAWERTVRGIKAAVKRDFFVNVATTATGWTTGRFLGSLISRGS